MSRCILEIQKDKMRRSHFLNELRIHLLYDFDQRRKSEHHASKELLEYLLLCGVILNLLLNLLNSKTDFNLVVQLEL